MDYDSYSFETTPYGETCVQAPYNKEREKKAYGEAMRFISMLTRRFKSLPYGCNFFIKRNNYETFFYYSIEMAYISNVGGVEAMLFVESHLPEKWDDDIVYNVRTGEET